MMDQALVLWKQILADPMFQNIPYKVETTKSGAIMMSPTSNWHGSAQSQIGLSLHRGRKDGEIINECSILTSDGVKVADVAWASEPFMAKHGYDTPYLVAPEICVEVVSPGNSQAEIERKFDLYLSRGALEVWVVHQDARIEYFAHAGQIKKSTLVKSVNVKKRG